MTWANVFSRLSDAADLPCTSPPVPARGNPRPPGVLQPGSAADAALSVLLEFDGFVPCQHIVRRTERSYGAVTWALSYLIRQGLLDAVSDDGRNPRYLKYRLTEKGRQYAKTRTSPVAQASSQRVAQHAQALPESEESRLAALRRLWDRDLPPVGDLRAVPGGHGSSADSNILARSQGCDGALHAGELPLDEPSRAAEATGVLSSGATQERTGADGCGGRAPAGDAGISGCQESTSAWVWPVARPAQEALPLIHLDPLAGNDIADTGVGPSPGHPAASLVASPAPDAA